jgi:hypothetical protein
MSVYEDKRLTVTGRQTYSIGITGNKAIRLLELILPYMRGKKEQAKMALFYPLGIRGKRPPQSDIDQRTWVVSELYRMKAA